ncbi:hypothetical protein EZV62_004813 [Acer yangbiense]|uniref:SART-1 family protein DOT2 n=1 Tax=Acer yangbiense TaxID=1000413 RepID=A0A5C7IL32_9ROSI|nr:hypothetical protein EZV62_004813 [Acer yangbiense]
MESTGLSMTEIGQFVWGLQCDIRGPSYSHINAFVDEQQQQEQVPRPCSEQESNDENLTKSIVAVDETMHEIAVGKGLSGAFKLLKDRGTFKKESGRDMDDKRRKLVDRFEHIHIDRKDEFGRYISPKETFRRLSYKFHSKGPGKVKQAKLMKCYQQELKSNQTAKSDTMERMRKAQARLKTPCLNFTGWVDCKNNEGQRFLSVKPNILKSPVGKVRREKEIEKITGNDLMDTSSYLDAPGGGI